MEVLRVANGVLDGADLKGLSLYLRQNLSTLTHPAGDLLPHEVRTELDALFADEIDDLIRRFGTEVEKERLGPQAESVSPRVPLSSRFGRLLRGGRTAPSN